MNDDDVSERDGDDGEPKLDPERDDQLRRDLQAIRERYDETFRRLAEDD